MGALRKEVCHPAQIEMAELAAAVYVRLRWGATGVLCSVLVLALDKLGRSWCGRLYFLDWWRVDEGRS